jgi:hypothetical protein
MGGSWVELGHATSHGGIWIHVGAFDMKIVHQSAIDVRATLANLLILGSQTFSSRSSASHRRRQIELADAEAQRLSSQPWGTTSLAIDGSQHDAEGIALGDRWISYTTVDDVCVYVHSSGAAASEIRLTREIDLDQYKWSSAAPKAPGRPRS